MLSRGQPLGWVVVEQIYLRMRETALMTLNFAAKAAINGVCGRPRTADGGVEPRAVTMIVVSEEGCLSRFVLGYRDLKL